VPHVRILSLSVPLLPVRWRPVRFFAVLFPVQAKHVFIDVSSLLLVAIDIEVFVRFSGSSGLLGGSRGVQTLVEVDLVFLNLVHDLLLCDGSSRAIFCILHCTHDTRVT